MGVIFMSQRTVAKFLWKVNSVFIRSAVDLAYKVHGKSPPGDGTPLVVLHGLLGSKRNWDSMSKKLASATQKNVIAADARNHGDSPHSGSHSYPDLASDVSKLIENLNINSAVVIGHSMGGRTGMVLALLEPAKVASLIVVDISPISTAGILNDFFPKLIGVMKSVDFKAASNPAEARNIAKDHILRSGFADNAQTLGFILMNIGLRQDKTIGWLYNLDTLKEFFPTIASFPEMEGKSYPGPTLFIGGEKSNYIPPEDLTGIKGYFPKVELTYVKGVGHNVHAENPTSFFNLVFQFLSRQ